MTQPTRTSCRCWSEEEASDDIDDDLLDRLISETRAFLKDHPDAEWGPSHVVLSDYNFDPDFIQNALVHEQDPATQTFLKHIFALTENE